MVHALIPAHNNKPEVLEVLRCLERQRYGDLNVLLVDDGSTDGTGDEVRRRFPRVRVLQGDGDLWWTGANVLGVADVLERAQEGDYLLLLNNDVSVDEGYVGELVTCSQSLGCATADSTIVDDRAPGPHGRRSQARPPASHYGTNRGLDHQAIRPR